MSKPPKYTPREGAVAVNSDCAPRSPWEVCAYPQDGRPRDRPRPSLPGVTYHKFWLNSRRSSVQGLELPRGAPARMRHTVYNEMAGTDRADERWVYLDFLIGAVNHGDQHVEQNDHHGHIVYSIKDVSDILYEFVVIFEHNGSHFGQPEYGPKQSLETFFYPVERIRSTVRKCTVLSTKKSRVNTSQGLCRWKTPS